jgi:hypothetical protein
LGRGITYVATVAARRAAAARVGIADGAFELHIAVVFRLAAVGAFRALHDVGHAAAVAVRVLALLDAAAGAGLGLVLVGHLEVGALSAGGVTGVAALAAVL